MKSDVKRSGKSLGEALRRIRSVRLSALPVWSLALLVFSCPVVFPSAHGCHDETTSPPIQAIHFYQKYISDLRYGRCRFEPSCSQYAIGAIEERGLLVGSALTADRLIRCNRHATRFYERGSSGRLQDPPGVTAYKVKKPEVPSWLLPEPGAVPGIPPPAASDSQAGQVSERLPEYAEFADALAERGDCGRARTEYERVAFVGGTTELEAWAHLRTAQCLFHRRSWSESAAEFSAAASLSGSGGWRNTACFMIAASHFNAGDYAECRRVLDTCRFEWMVDGAVTMENWLFLYGLCAMGLGDWNTAGDRFEEISMTHPGSHRTRLALFLKEKSGGQRSLPQRSPAVASVSSALLPGSGQLYTGHTYDGIRHFLFNGLLGYAVYHLADDENYAGAYLLGALALPFYTGNIIGARRSAERFNRSRRSEYLSEAISAAGELTAKPTP
jgi:putative membrane protein insertion efficiency factor